MTTDQYQSRISLNKEADPNNSAETTLNYRRQTWNAEKDDLRNLLRSNSSLTHELVKMTRLKGTEFTVIEGIYLQGKTVSSIAKDYKMPITKLIDTEKFVVTKLLLAYQQYLTRYPSTNRLKDLNRQIGLYRDKKIPEDHIETIPEPEPISDKNNYVDSDRSSQVIAVTEKLTSKQVPDTGSQTVDLEDIVQVKAVKDDEDSSEIPEHIRFPDLEPVWQPSDSEIAYDPAVLSDMCYSENNEDALNCLIDISKDDFDFNPSEEISYCPLAVFEMHASENPETDIIEMIDVSRIVSVLDPSEMKLFSKLYLSDDIDVFRVGEDFSLDLSELCSKTRVLRRKLKKQYVSTIAKDIYVPVGEKPVSAVSKNEGLATLEQIIGERKENRRKRLEQLPRIVESLPTGEKKYSAPEISEQSLAALMLLNFNQCWVFSEKYLKGKKAVQIADDLGVSVARVYQLDNEGLRRIIRYMKTDQ